MAPKKLVIFEPKDGLCAEDVTSDSSQETQQKFSTRSKAKGVITQGGMMHKSIPVFGTCVPGASSTLHGQSDDIDVPAMVERMLSQHIIQVKGAAIDNAAATLKTVAAATPKTAAATTRKTTIAATHANAAVSTEETVVAVTENNTTAATDEASVEDINYVEDSSAMLDNTLSLEERVSIMARILERVMKTIKERDSQIAYLMNKIKNMGDSSYANDVPSQARHSDTTIADAAPKASVQTGAAQHAEIAREQLSNTDVASRTQSSSRTIDVATDGSIPAKLVQDFIKEALKSQIEGSSSTLTSYVKPYTRRIDMLKMPINYQPPKFQQFDGKGNPRQHVTHFVETCNNTRTDGDLLVKQFVRSLRGNAFDWYIDLAPGSIDSWNQLEHAFLNRFYSTRRTVSMIELTNSHQLKDEPVIDYIQRWRNLSLNCKDRLTELSAIDMCIQGMRWELCYILQGIRPHTFEELATCAHDMEMSMKANVV